MEYYWELRSKNAQNIKAIICPLYYCSRLYICHTKAMTTLVEYGTKCLCEGTNFYSVLIVRSAP